MVDFTQDAAAPAGFFSPIRFEADIYDCEVWGKVPTDIEGNFYRMQCDFQYRPPQNEWPTGCRPGSSTMRRGSGIGSWPAGCWDPSSSRAWTTISAEEPSTVEPLPCSSSSSSARCRASGGQRHPSKDSSWALRPHIPVVGSTARAGPTRPGRRWLTPESPAGSSRHTEGHRLPRRDANRQCQGRRPVGLRPCLPAMSVLLAHRLRRLGRAVPHVAARLRVGTQRLVRRLRCRPPPRRTESPS